MLKYVRGLPLCWVLWCILGSFSWIPWEFLGKFHLLFWTFCLFVLVCKAKKKGISNLFLSIISGLEEEVSSKVDNFAHLWPKKWDPFFPSSTSQSKLDPLRNLASASPPGCTFTNGSVSPLQTVSLATKPPFHDQSTVSLLKFDFLRRPARLGRWRKQPPKTNISDTRVGLYKRELHWGGLSVDGVSAESPPPSLADGRRPWALEEAMLVAENRWEWCSD